MMDLIGRGRTAEIYSYDENRVIKIFHHDFSHLAEVEYIRVKAIVSTGVTAPNVYEIIDIDNKKAIVYEYVHGISMLSLIQQSPIKVFIYAKQLAALHNEVHSKTLKGLPNLKEVLHEDINRIDLLKQNDKDSIFKYLELLPEGDRLCHYDFHPGNILIDNDKANIIDWMTVSTGDPKVDVCRTSLILLSKAQPYNTSVVEKVFIGIFRKLLYRGYIKHYLDISGSTIAQVEQWMLPIAAARLAEGIESESQFLHDIISYRLSLLRYE